MHSIMYFYSSDPQKLFYLSNGIVCTYLNFSLDFLSLQILDKSMKLLSLFALSAIIFSSQALRLNHQETSPAGTSDTSSNASQQRPQFKSFGPPPNFNGTFPGNSTTRPNFNGTFLPSPPRGFGPPPDSFNVTRLNQNRPRPFNATEFQQWKRDHPRSDTQSSHEEQEEHQKWQGNESFNSTQWEEWRKDHPRNSTSRREKQWRNNLQGNQNTHYEASQQQNWSPNNSFNATQFEQWRKNHARNSTEQQQWRKKNLRNFTGKPDGQWRQLNKNSPPTVLPTALASTIVETPVNV